MSLEEKLRLRCAGKCELCAGETALVMYEVPPTDGVDIASSCMICNKCRLQIEKKEVLDHQHWACLSNSMWSEVPGVQVVSWRMLNRLRQESWAADSLEMMYLDDELLIWAKATGDHENDASVAFHKDCNGAQLLDGDTVILTKSLDVKGSTLNARMGTVVKNIRLVADNIEQIEGRIEGQQIVILTKYLRKQGAAMPG